MGSNDEQRKITCKITDIQPDPKHDGRMLIAVEFDDGNVELGPWRKAFSVLPEKVLTIDDFMDQLYHSDIERPADPYVYLREFMDSEKSFTLQIPSKIEPGDGS